MLRAEGFTFQYPTRSEPSLSDVSFAVEAGEVLGVVGPVEAGKTTLAMAMSSFAPQNTGGTTEGDLQVAGRDPREADDDDVAMVFEDYSAQLTQVRVVDEVLAPLVNRGLDRTEARDRAGDLLETVGLADDRGKYTWDLSGGQQQRLAIAAALAVDPEVLVFDTATDMLDPEGREDVTDLVASLAGEKTLVVTANDPDDLVGVADRVLVLEDGERVAFGDADELLRDRELLRGVGVNAPLCVEVAHRVGLDAAPLSPGEFAELFAPGPAADAGRELTPASPDGGESTPTEQDRTIDVDAATYEYADGTVAVDGVDLGVHEGEVHAVVGGNGAGKSTFGKLLVGLLNPDDGHVRVSGTPTTDSSAGKLATSIGIALQNPDEQLSEETVEDELRFPLERRQHERKGLFGLRTEKRYDEAYVDERVEAVRELVGLDESVLDEDPIFLPRGRQRLVTMGLAVAPDPDAVVLDEPTAGLDAANAATVTAAIERLRADGKAVVLIDHDMDFVCAVADRVTVLDDGEIVEQGPTREVFAADNRERLAEHHMRPPRAARLARELGLEALTVDGLADELRVAMEGRA